MTHEELVRAYNELSKEYDALFSELKDVRTKYAELQDLWDANRQFAEIGKAVKSMANELKIYLR